MSMKFKRSAHARTCILVLALSASGCASTSATKQISSLAGSSVGAVAANAISVAGPWGYVVSIATTALGGFAGSKAAALFGGKARTEQLSALAKVLESQQPAALEKWGAQDGKSSGGYAEATSPVFTANSGASCRSFMMVTYKKKGGLSLDPAAIQNAAGAVGDVKESADKLSNVSNVGDAVSGAKSAAGAVSNAKDTVTALTPGQAPAETTAAARPAGAEAFGTACKDARNVWQVIKAST